MTAPGVQFPTAQPFLENWFHNQQENLNDDGYDSEGNLPHFADMEGDDLEGYDEDAIDAFAASVPVPVATLTVESMGRLGIKELKDELHKNR